MNLARRNRSLEGCAANVQHLTVTSCSGRYSIRWHSTMTRLDPRQISTAQYLVMILDDFSSTVCDVCDPLRRNYLSRNGITFVEWTSDKQWRTVNIITANGSVCSECWSRYPICWNLKIFSVLENDQLHFNCNLYLLEPILSTRILERCAQLRQMEYIDNHAICGSFLALSCPGMVCDQCTVTRRRFVHRQSQHDQRSDHVQMPPTWIPCQWVPIVPIN